jgi:hypothetical protein
MTFDPEEEDRVSEKLYHQYGANIENQEQFNRATEAFFDKAPDGKGLTPKRKAWAKRLWTAYKKGGYLRAKKGGKKSLAIREEFKPEKPGEPKVSESIVLGKYDKIGKNKLKRGYIKVRMERITHKYKDKLFIQTQYRAKNGQFASIARHSTGKGE